MHLHAYIAAMPSAVEICNIALSHIGAESLVTAIDPPDGSVEAGYCATFYPIARRLALEMTMPSYAKTRVALAEVANTSTSWGYAYAKPADCIKPLRVLDPWDAVMFADDPRVVADPTERGSADYEVEGDVIRTNEPDAVLIYLRDVTDTSKFSPMFTSGLGMLLAGYLAGPVIKGRDGMSIGNSWTEAGMNALGRAAASDANASSERAEFIPSSIQARE